MPPLPLACRGLPDPSEFTGFAPVVLRLIHSSTVLEALCKAAQQSEAAAICALRACARWLHLQHADRGLRAQKKAAASGGRFTAQLIRQNLHENPLVLRAAQAGFGDRMRGC